MLELFLTFAKIGLFTFGGGYAMIALIEDICVEKKKWITHDQMMDITVVAESTPGPIAINCATYIGYQNHGFRGSLAATAGIVFPSFVIIYVISIFLDRLLEIAVIASAFRGIKVAVGLLILNAGLNMLTKIPKKAQAVPYIAWGFCGMMLISLFSLNFSSAALLLTAGAVSLILFAFRRRGGRS